MHACILPILCIHISMNTNTKKHDAAHRGPKERVKPPSNWWRNRVNQQRSRKRTISSPSQNYQPQTKERERENSAGKPLKIYWTYKDIQFKRIKIVDFLKGRSISAHIQCIRKYFRSQVCIFMCHIMYIAHVAQWSPILTISSNQLTFRLVYCAKKENRQDK